MESQTIKRCYLQLQKEPEEVKVHIQPNDVPIKVNAPGAVTHQQMDFGDASNY